MGYSTDGVLTDMTVAKITLQSFEGLNLHKIISIINASVEDLQEYKKKINLNHYFYCPI